MIWNNDHEEDNGILKKWYFDISVCSVCFYHSLTKVEVHNLKT